MKNLFRLILLTAGCAFIATGGVYLGYRYLSGIFTAPQPEAAHYSQTAEADIPEPDFANKAQTSADGAAHDADIKLSSGAKLVYEYYYENDGHVETVEDNAPYFMYGLSREAVAKLNNGWEIKEFTDARVVMRKNVEAGQDAHYIIGEKDGYLAVFYKNDAGAASLKEITTTPINALSPDEQLRIKEGITVKDSNNLIRLLEDYGS